MVQKTTVCNEKYKSYIESKNADKKKSYLKQIKRKDGRICEKENFIYYAHFMHGFNRMRGGKRKWNRNYR